LNGELTLREALEVQQFFRLPSPALVEKDYQVIRALAAIDAVDTGVLRLVFQGGTALSRAHRLTSRMSEDIDLRIVSDAPPTRDALRKLRGKIADALERAGFRFNSRNPAHMQSRNSSRYTIYRVPYDPVSRGEGVLRPEIQIETAVWPLRLPSSDLTVSSFVAEAYKRPPEVVDMPCVSVVETVADKFVAMTRRIAEELAHPGAERDATLVRHMYDLHVARPHYDLTEVAKLVPAIIQSDADSYGNKFPEYRDDPVSETRRAVEGLANIELYARDYEGFQRGMVYGEQVAYRDCLVTLDELVRTVLAHQGF
jgi:hypothetical protein